VLPTWPFEWPLPGHERLRRLPEPLMEFVRRALQVDERKRFRDAVQMLAAYRRIRPAVLRGMNGTPASASNTSSTGRHSWRTLRVTQFKRAFKGPLRLDRACGSCHEPVDERMGTCPWCAAAPLEATGESKFPATCPRCERGIKLDWNYCPWCYGARIGPASTRTYTDQRYIARCPRCSERTLMPFMHYCPACNAKVARHWRLGEGDDKCPKCEHGVARAFWSACPWCGTELPRD
jgi:Zn-finger nucleic acid-binding protein